MLKQIIIFGKTGKKSLMQEFANCFFPFETRAVVQPIPWFHLSFPDVLFDQKGHLHRVADELPPELKTLPQELSLWQWQSQYERATKALHPMSFFFFDIDFRVENNPPIKGTQSLFCELQRCHCSNNIQSFEKASLIPVTFQILQSKPLAAGTVSRMTAEQQLAKKEFI